MTEPQARQAQIEQARAEWNAGHVRALRRFMGMSQSAFATELGVRQQTVSEWETGVYRPRGASATLLTMVGINCGFIRDPDRSASFGSVPAYSPSGARGQRSRAVDPARLLMPSPGGRATRPEVAI